MTRSRFIRFKLNLSYEQYFAVYQGVAKTIITRADDGRSISFPAGNVQRYLDRDGVNGYFEMELTAENKFVAIKRISA